MSSLSASVRASVLRYIRRTHVRKSVDRYLRDRGLVEAYRGKKPIAGQQALWNEEDHPRDSDGKFSEKEDGKRPGKTSGRGEGKRLAPCFESNQCTNSPPDLAKKIR